MLGAQLKGLILKVFLDAKVYRMALLPGDLLGQKNWFDQYF